MKKQEYARTPTAELIDLLWLPGRITLAEEALAILTELQGRILSEQQVHILQHCFPDRRQQACRQNL